MVNQKETETINRLITESLFFIEKTRFLAENALDPLSIQKFEVKEGYFVTLI